MSSPVRGRLTAAAASNRLQDVDLPVYGLASLIFSLGGAKEDVVLANFGHTSTRRTIDGHVNFVPFPTCTCYSGFRNCDEIVSSPAPREVVWHICSII